MHKIFLVVCFWAPFWSCRENEVGRKMVGGA